MISVCKYFKSTPFNGLSSYIINGDLYSGQALEQLKEKAIELGIKVPECLENDIPICFNAEYNKYHYTTFAEYYAIELPQGMEKNVRDYILEDLFKGQNEIIFSAAMMQENGLELVEYSEATRNRIYTHYIDYKGIRFLLNLTHLKTDLSLQTDHVIIYLNEQLKHQRTYQFLLSTTQTELACAEKLKCFEQTKVRYEKILDSADEVVEMIQAILNVFCQKKRLIVAPECFVNDMRLYWERTATAEELFEDETCSYGGIARFFADLLPNTVLMYATSTCGLVGRYEHLKAYSHSASKSYCGNAESNKLTYMSSTELKTWSTDLTTQINQVVAEQGIDEVYIYLYKGYMKNLNLNHQWYEPMKDQKAQSIPSNLSRVDNIQSMMKYLDLEFMSNTSSVCIV